MHYHMPGRPKNLFETNPLVLNPTPKVQTASSEPAKWYSNEAKINICDFYLCILSENGNEAVKSLIYDFSYIIAIQNGMIL